MTKFILQTLTFLFSFNLLAYEIDGIAPSGFDFDTICGIEASEIRTYRNLVEAHQISLERLKDMEHQPSGTEEYLQAQGLLNSSKELLDTQIKTMVTFNIGSTLVATVRVILSKDYTLKSSLFFEQVDNLELKMTKMTISPSTFNEETMSFQVSQGVVLIELSSSALCVAQNQGKTLEQAIQSYLDIVFKKPLYSEGQPFISQDKPFISEGQPFISQGKPFISEGKPVM